MSLEENHLELTPLKGKSGKAYIGQYPDGQRVFVKKDTTPILVALAKEQIAPQLLWAERQEDGAMMSVQEWLHGRILTREDMTSKQIVHILHRLHKSRKLVNQLISLDYSIESPHDLLVKLEDTAPTSIRENSFVRTVIADLRRHLPNFDPEKATIVHGDVRHNNWIITTSGLIYLVDWDSVRVTDRLYDVAYLLSRYIPRMNWDNWLSYYGYKEPSLIIDKVRWYGQFLYLSQMVAHYLNGDLQNVNKEIYALRKFREQF